MNRLRILSTIGLAVATAGLLGAPGAGAAAARRVESTPAFRIAGFEVRGSGGWVLGVSASPGRGEGTPGSIGLTTHGPHHEEVDYIGLEAKVTADGRIVAKSPGLDHIAVRFEQTSETVLDVHPRKGCTVEGKPVILKGVFRGTIAFHGERGYTTVARRSARGEIADIPREVCKRRQHRPPPHETPGEAGLEFLLAGRDMAGGTLEFSAFRLDRDPGEAAPTTEFTARFVRERDGILTIARTEISDEEAGDFSLIAPGGKPSEATVSPAAPFSGSATFKLESPTTASWTGDLGVEVPTLGTVSLDGPGFWAGACAAHCTKTFPPGAELGFFSASPLALGRSR